MYTSVVLNCKIFRLQILIVVVLDVVHSCLGFKYKRPHELLNFDSHRFRIWAIHLSVCPSVWLSVWQSICINYMKGLRNNYVVYRTLKIIVLISKHVVRSEVKSRRCVVEYSWRTSRWSNTVFHVSYICNIFYFTLMYFNLVI